jgi:hypothetical protein
MINNKRKMKMPDAMKLNGGWNLSDLERARIELKETQMKLNGTYIPPEQRPGMISKKDALEALHETQMKLAARFGNQDIKEPKDLKDARAQLGKTQQKFNNKYYDEEIEKPRTVAEARRQLRRTQSRKY